MKTPYLSLNNKTIWEESKGIRRLFCLIIWQKEWAVTKVTAHFSYTNR
ncbi:hypothetical protein RU93_GL002174 [Enterococcus aquimarinus]|uniref:Uncharacterized protein n=1 Tax=Enterococcus aquimarinus TaxID=328396 RepID=A0A1L8QS90_9ENTE|nr:hypothetical protein RU93_GL002174 [Enterococcus aquimarinus]